jgi:hypothetical protein
MVIGLTHILHIAHSYKMNIQLEKTIILSCSALLSLLALYFIMHGLMVTGLIAQMVALSGLLITQHHKRFKNF